MFAMASIVIPMTVTLMTASASSYAAPKNQHVSTRTTASRPIDHQPLTSASQRSSIQDRDQKAHEVIREMGRVLSAAQTISVKIICKLRMEEPGLKSTFEVQYRVRLKRPNRFAIIAVGQPIMAFSFICDGKALMRYSPQEKTYEVCAAPRTPAEMLSRQYPGSRLGALEETFFWVLVSAPDQALLDRAGVQADGQLEYVGLDRLGDTECDVVRLTDEYVQTSLWIETGARPLPRRIEIRDNQGRKEPSDASDSKLLTLFDDWDLRADIPDAEFDFTPPAGSRDRTALPPIHAGPSVHPTSTRPATSQPSGELTDSGSAPVTSQRAAPDGRQILRKMARLLRETQTFRVSVTSRLCSKAPGNSEEYEGRYRVSLKRPDRFAILVADSPWLGKSYVSDGEMLVEYSPYSQRYEVAKAPRRLSDFLSGQYDGPGPGALEDLFLCILVPDADQELLDRALVKSDEQIKYLGLADMEGAQCHVLQLTNDYGQVLLWIQTGPEPLPRRFEDRNSEHKKKAVNSMETKSVVSFTDWDVGPNLPDAEFHFAPPAGSTRIDKGSPG